MSAKLYQALDALAGGLPTFMAEGADETWRQDGHPTFTLTTLTADRLLFGFRVRYGLDAHAPDPIYNVKVDPRHKTAQVLLVDTLKGYRHVKDGEGVAEAEEAAALATKMLHRRQGGGVEVERFCHWAKEAA